MRHHLWVWTAYASGLLTAACTPAGQHETTNIDVKAKGVAKPASEASKEAERESRSQEAGDTGGRLADDINDARDKLRDDERILGSGHLQVASDLEQLGQLYLEANQSREAVPALSRAIAIRETMQDSDKAGIASAAARLAQAHLKLGDFEEAKPLLRKALSLQEQSGLQRVEYADNLRTLAAVYSRQGEPEQAKPLLESALTVQQRELSALSGDVSKAEPANLGASAILEQQRRAAMKSFNATVDQYAALLSEMGESPDAIAKHLNEMPGGNDKVLGNSWRERMHNDANHLQPPDRLGPADPETNQER